jgi:apolipoprotein N-acyltransferase
MRDMAEINVGREAREGTTARGAGRALLVCMLATGPALASGVALAASVTVPALGPLAFLALAPLLAATRAASPLGAAASGWLAGATCAGAGLAFLHDTIAKEGYFSSGMAAVIVAVLALFEGVPLGVALAVRNAVEARGRLGGLAFVAALVALERVWPSPLPFAWGMGLAHEEGFVAASAWLGPVVPTAIAASSSVAIAAMIAGRGAWREAIAAGAVLLAMLGAGLVERAQTIAATAEAPTLRVGLVQAGGAAREVGLSRSIDATNGLARAGVDLVVWSESSLPGAVRAEAVEPAIAAAIGPFSTPIALGVVLDHDDGTRTNSALLVTEGRVVARHDKRALLPFAERLPFEDVAPWLRAISPRSGRFRAGATRPAWRVDEHAVAATICYEDALASHARRLLRESAGEAIVNLTNDAWFAGSHEPETHLLAAKLRAIELGRSVVRATTDGVTAAIAPTGRVLARAPRGEASALVAEVPWSVRATPWARWGDALSVAVVAALALGASARQRRPLGSPAKVSRRESAA